MRALQRRNGRDVFRPDEIVQEVLATNPNRWQETTVRTHVTAHMCSDVPHHLHPDLERVDRGLYRVLVSGPAREGSRRSATVALAPTDGYSFERHAATVINAEWEVELSSRPVRLAEGVVKKFDLVSSDRAIVGDAKHYKNLPTPAAKWSTIAEYVWLLQHVQDAKRRFLVFGLDREVPERWLERFRPLTKGIDFWFLDGETLERL